MTTHEDTPESVTDDAAAPASGEDAPAVERDPDGSVTTGILAAERRAQDEISRRRRLLVGGAVLGLVIAGAVLAVMTVLQQQANHEAEIASDRAEARAAFAEAVVDRAEDYEPPATQVEQDAGELRATLEQFLTETDATDDELAQRADALVARIEEQAATIEELTARDVPQPPELVDADRAVAVLRELETLRAEAGALEAEAPVALNDVAQWRGVVTDVNQAVADHVEQVESEEATSDPDELIALWRDERPFLLRLSAAATAADGVPGLEAWAGAHQQYAEDLLAWIEEAVGLLEDGEIETYNERFDELFDTEDPFGFNAAVAAATDDALASPALLQLGTLQERAVLVREAVDRAEITAAEQLGGDAPAG